MNLMFCNATRLVRTLAIGLSLAMSAAATHAETIAIPLGQQGQAWDVATPNHGATKADVEARFGSPLAQNGPVGEPPISTWEYEQFDVYFEGDRVIHAVVKKQPRL